ncbi:MAG: hypothetical protein EBY32_03470 [Proteobacteria bacterium]|nr:hypothetical protein [Pseudomonadota bacterium]
MKILVIGQKLPYFFETVCARVFSELGCEVYQVDPKPVRWWLGNKDWFQLSRPARQVQDFLASYEIYHAAKKFKPDLIFACKAENIRSEIYTLLKKEIGCRLAIWYVDNPFNYNVSSYQSLRAIHKSDFYFIWAKYLMDPLISAGASNVYFLPFAYDPVAYPSDLEFSEEEFQKWRSDVCFVGTWDKFREKSLEPLADREFEFAIYGQGWVKNLSLNSALKKHVRSDAIWLNDTVKAIKGAKLVINLLRRHNWKGHNFRTMEVAGIGGGALATPWTEDQAKNLFTENEEILCFDGDSPSPDLIAEWLKNPEMLRKIAGAARNRVLKDHLLEYRLKEILNLTCK